MINKTHWKMLVSHNNIVLIFLCFGGIIECIVRHLLIITSPMTPLNYIVLKNLSTDIKNVSPQQMTLQGDGILNEKGQSFFLQINEKHAFLI